MDRDRPAFRQFGQGSREVLAAHCSLAHAGAWQALAAALDDRITLTAFDLPGHGKSPDWDGVADIQDVSVGFARALLPDDGRVDLLGHSFGATVMLRLALERPEAVRSLCLIEPVFFAAAYRRDPSIRARHSEELAPFVAAWRAGDRETATALFTQAWGSGVAWSDLPPAQQARMIARIHLIPAAEPALHDDAADLLGSGRLEALAVPVCLMRGEQSHWIMPSILRELGTRLQAPHEVTIAGAGHMAPITHAEQVAKSLRAFWTHV